MKNKIKNILIYLADDIKNIFPYFFAFYLVAAATSFLFNVWEFFYWPAFHWSVLLFGAIVFVSEWLGRRSAISFQPEQRESMIGQGLSLASGNTARAIYGRLVRSSVSVEQRLGVFGDNLAKAIQRLRDKRSLARETLFGRYFWVGVKKLGEALILFLKFISMASVCCRKVFAVAGGAIIFLASVFSETAEFLFTPLFARVTMIIKKMDTVDWVLTVMAALILVYALQSGIDSVYFAILFFGLVSVLWKKDSRIAGTAFLVSLLLCGVFLAYIDDASAETMSKSAYCFFIITVLSSLRETM